MARVVTSSGERASSMKNASCNHECGVEYCDSNYQNRTTKDIREASYVRSRRQRTLSKNLVKRTCIAIYIFAGWKFDRRKPRAQPLVTARASQLELAVQVGNNKETERRDASNSRGESIHMSNILKAFRHTDYPQTVKTPSKYGPTCVWLRAAEYGSSHPNDDTGNRFDN